MYYLGIDLGGTNIASGILNEENQIIVRSNRKTNVTDNPEDLCGQMAEAAFDLLKKADLTLDDIPWVGIGTPGIIDRANGMVKFSSNLQLRDVPLKKLVEDKIGKKVIIDNDANAAAYGEYKAGVLRGTKNAIAITIGTGIGSGIIIDGKIFSNFAGGEMGHTVIEYNGRQCSCGRRGCWDVYASATGLIFLTKEAMRTAGGDCLLWKYAEGKLENVNGKMAFQAMREGDPDGKWIINQYIEYLGCGIMNCINIFQPDILCIGGGVSNEGDSLLSPLKTYIERESASMGAKRPELCLAELGNDAGIIGAALLGLI